MQTFKERKLGFGERKREKGCRAILKLLLWSKNKMSFLSIEISNIGRPRHDIVNRKSVGQKIKKIAKISIKYQKFPIFRQNFQTKWHARVGYDFFKK